MHAFLGQSDAEKLTAIVAMRAARLRDLHDRYRGFGLMMAKQGLDPCLPTATLPDCDARVRFVREAWVPTYERWLKVWNEAHNYGGATFAFSSDWFAEQMDVFESALATLWGLAKASGFAVGSSPDDIPRYGSQEANEYSRQEPLGPPASAAPDAPKGRSGGKWWILAGVGVVAVGVAVVAWRRL